MASTRTVLVVTDRASFAGELGAALEAMGYEVLACPGPQPPSYVCLGTGGTCPLAAAADAVVVDCDLRSDAALQGTPSWELVGAYAAAGLPVVAIARSQEGEGALFAAGVKVLSPSTPLEAVAEAVRAAVEQRAPREVAGIFDLEQAPSPKPPARRDAPGCAAPLRKLA